MRLLLTAVAGEVERDADRDGYEDGYDRESRVGAHVRCCDLPGREPIVVSTPSSRMRSRTGEATATSVVAGAARLSS